MLAKGAHVALYFLHWLDGVFILNQSQDIIIQVLNITPLRLHEFSW